MRKLIRESLEDDYFVFEAENGLQGLDIGTAELPDLIITDVSMEPMDGNELCKKLKEDVRTSHIPIVMLTARVAVEQQLEGLESGADVYLTKPFNEQVLLKYVSNLIKSKELLRQKFSQKIFIEPMNIEIGTVDKKFMANLMSVVESNLSNSEFSVNDICREIGMSITGLYRKFNALVNIPIAEYIKNVRLTKAAFLLTHDKFNITEIAWDVGFNDSKYFSKEFKKFYGVTPSD